MWKEVTIFLPQFTLYFLIYNIYMATWFKKVDFNKEWDVHAEFKLDKLLLFSETPTLHALISTSLLP